MPTRIDPLLVSALALKTSYVLDGQDNVTIAGNTTLAGLPGGMHNVTVMLGMLLETLATLKP